jgi:hypothetical protein
MFIQHVIKGIINIGPTAADDILFRSGIQCNWLRHVGKIYPYEISEKLKENVLNWHLNRYDDIDPDTNAPFCDNTPFISTTAGTVEQDTRSGYFCLFAPFPTALWFATQGYTQPGYIFYGYVFTLGKKSIEHWEFAEETRDLHVYAAPQQYHPEGEVVAKIHIPSERLERWEYYDPFASMVSQNGQHPKPMNTSRPNPNYQRPDRIHNIRSLLI